MKRPIRIGFSDFWQGFDPKSNYFVKLLSKKYDVTVCDEPDFLIYSCFGFDFTRYDCRRIFYTGENATPDFGVCDHAFTFSYIDRPEHYRLPYYGTCTDMNKLIKKPDFDAERALAEKTGFCAFVYTNPRGLARNLIFEKLSKYKKVDSGGRWINNVGGPVKDKLGFSRQHKFTICFENASSPGYTTEKLLDGMLVSSVPIYWGNPLVHLDFDTSSFVNYHERTTGGSLSQALDELVEQIIELDRNDARYLEILSRPWFHGNEVHESVRPENILAQFDRIFEDEREPIARTQRYRAVNYPRFRARVALKQAYQNLGFRLYDWRHGACPGAPEGAGFSTN